MAEYEPHRHAVTTIARRRGGGVGTSANFSNPWHAYVYDDNTLYVGENTHRIRKIDLANNNNVTTLTGNGANSGVTSATTSTPLFHSNGTLYFTSYATHYVRKLEFGSSLEVVDVDGDTMTANLAVNNGVLDITLAGSASISAGTSPPPSPSKVPLQTSMLPYNPSNTNRMPTSQAPLP